MGCVFKSLNSDIDINIRIPIAYSDIDINVTGFYRLVKTNNITKIARQSQASEEAPH